MNDPNATPLEINPSTARTVILMLVRVLGIIATAVGTLAAFVKTRDLAGFIVWVKSDDFVQLLTALGLLVSFGSSLWVTIQRKRREVLLARNVPDRVAVVKEPAAVIEP